MPDLGLLSGIVGGFMSKGIDMAINKILYHANIARCCRKELNSLTDLVTRIRPIARQIRQYRLELNRKKETSSVINEWIDKLQDLLEEAEPIVRNCSISKLNVISRYQTSNRISTLISEIEKHLSMNALVNTLLGLEKQRGEGAQASSSTFASTSQTPTGRFFIDDDLIVGQEESCATLEKLVIDAEVKSLFCTGVLGKGGSGKTLLLKRVFNSQEVKNHFGDGLLLWLTISQSPSFSSLRNELYKQIVMQTKEDHGQVNEGDLKGWLNDRMRAKRFALFLDDVWDGGGRLREELGLDRLTEPSNSKIIVSSRNRSALSQMGVADTATLEVGDLSEAKSWELFAYHAFPYNKRNLPPAIEKRSAKLVCDQCGGLPLAIKVIGRTMAGSIDAQQWELAILKLPNDNKKDHQDLHDCLRLSYDALGDYEVNLQLCFLYVAAFTKDQIIDVEMDLIPLWLGEGLLESPPRYNPFENPPGYNPLEMGRIYADLLANRCLIEPLLKDVNGRVIRCRIHDILRGLAIRIAEQDERFYCRTGNGLPKLVENNLSGCIRLLLNFNQLSLLPKSFRAPNIRSLLIGRNNFTKIPTKVIESMVSLTVLDLCGTPVESLPNSLGCLKQLVYLNLRGVPIKRLPAALTDLETLQFIDLSESRITKLPSGIQKLRSLRYLNLSCCDYLQCLPRSVSHLTSLQYLDLIASPVWTKQGKKQAASVNDLGSLTQLKKLSLKTLVQMETFAEGTLGCLRQMETLDLYDEKMISLPGDMMRMTRLKRLRLICPEIVTIHDGFCEFQNLIHLHLCCDKLEVLPGLHKLRRLRQLCIHGCSKLEVLPAEFGDEGAFPLLEIFSLVKLDQLKELPTLRGGEGVMPSLKIFTLMECEALNLLPEHYSHLKALQKIRVYGCSLIENLERIRMINTKVKVVTMSITNVQIIREKYDLMIHTGKGCNYSEIWCEELYLFLQYLYGRL